MSIKGAGEKKEKKSMELATYRLTPAPRRSSGEIKKKKKSTKRKSAGKALKDGNTSPHVKET